MATVAEEDETIDDEQFMSVIQFLPEVQEALDEVCSRP
jgi:hypothetical protein